MFPIGINSMSREWRSVFVCEFGLADTWHSSIDLFIRISVYFCFNEPQIRNVLKEMNGWHYNIFVAICDFTQYLFSLKHTHNLIRNNNIFSYFFFFRFKWYTLEVQCPAIETFVHVQYGTAFNMQMSYFPLSFQVIIFVHFLFVQTITKRYE